MTNDRASSIMKMFEDLEKVMPLVPGSSERRDSTWGKDGTFECPVCGGTIAWSRSDLNGHLRLRCSTRSCVGLME